MEVWRIATILPKECGGWDTEGKTQLLDVDHGDIAFAQLHVGKVAVVNTCLIGEFFNGQIEFVTPPPDGAADPRAWVIRRRWLCWFVDHGSTLSAL